MALLSIPFAGGLLKVRRKSEMRTAEVIRSVRVFDLGFIIVAWWSADAVKRDLKDRGRL